MQKAILFLSILVFSAISELKATHLMGGYARYEYLGRQGNTNNHRYRITINAYRDCQGIVHDDNISVCIYDNNSRTIHESYNFRNTLRRFVDPVGFVDCPEDTTACIELAVYEDIVILPQNNFGYTIRWQRCCRNRQVNLPNEFHGNQFQPSQGQTYQIVIPSTNIENNSPVIPEVPVPYVCLNDTTQVRITAFDPDGDSLSFKLAHPWSGGALGSPSPGCVNFLSNPSPVNYVSGFSAQEPFGSTGFAHVNPISGTLTVMSRILGNFAISIDVEEWRNGVLLGITRLDIQMLILTCPPNDPPFLTPQSRVFNREVMAGQELCFDITAIDPDDDNVRIRGIGQIFNGGAGWSGPTANLPQRTAPSRVTTTFCWKTSCEQGRSAPYSFVLEAIDDGCPARYVNETYLIFVRPFVSNITLQGPPQVCFGEEGTEYTITNTLTGSTLEWEVIGGDLVEETNQRAFVNWDFSNTSGKIRVRELSQGGCNGAWRELDVTFLSKPDSPSIDGPDSVCLFSNNLFSSSKSGFSYRWIMPDNSTRQTRNVLFLASQLGVHTLKHFVINAQGCPSDTITKEVQVVTAEADSLDGPSTVCPNNGNIEFKVFGPFNSTYQWFADGAVIESGQGTSTVRMGFGEEGVIMVKAVEITSIGCVGDTLYKEVLVTYDLRIEQPEGLSSVCEFTEREMYIPVPRVFNTSYFYTVVGGDIDEVDSQYNLFVNWGEAGLGVISYFQIAFDTLNSKQCISNTSVLNVQINPYPLPEEIQGEFGACQFTPDLLFNIKGFPRSEFTWEVNGSSSLNGQGTNQISFSTEDPGVFQISVFETTEHGCIGELVDSVFEVYPKPVTSPIEGPAVLCFSGITDVEFSVNGFEGSEFFWVVEDGVRVDSGGNAPSIVVDFTGKQNNTVKVFEVSEYGCEGDTLLLNVFIDSIGLEIIYATVSPPPNNDRQLIVEWELLNAPRYDTTFTILKRKVLDGARFEKVGEVPGNVFSFTMDDVNTKDYPFEFSVIGANLCGELSQAPPHTTVWLHGEKPETYIVEMEFTDYLGWNEGVLDYTLYRSLQDKTPFEPFDAFISPIRVTYENGLEHYTQCYRVKATENDGNEAESWSNELCFNFPPVMYIPNVFSPNRDGLNDMFLVSAGAIKTFNIKIFNRWGEQLFESDDIQNGWDGTFSGVECQQGVYLYIVEYSDYADKKYANKGTVHLVR